MFLNKKIFVLILLIAFCLRLPLLQGSFWLDEAAQALESVRPLSAQLNISADFQPPLFHIIVHFFSLVSHAEWWLRMPSLLAGLGTIAVLYLLLSEHFGKRAALIGSLLLALSPFHIFYSQELRPYALAAFFAMVSWLFLLRKNFTSYTLVSILGMYTMYLYPFNLLAQLLFVFFERRASLRSMLYSLFAIVLLLLPWLPSFFGQLRAGMALTESLPGWSSAVATPQFKAIPLTLGKFFVGTVPFQGHPVLLLSIAIFFLFFAFSLVPHLREKKERWLWYWLTIPILTSWLFSFVIPVIQPKRLLFVLPALVGLLALRKGKLGSLLVLSAIAVELFSFLLYVKNPMAQREDWRGVIRRIEREAPAESIALFSFPEAFAPWRWYENGSVKTLSTGTLRLTEGQELSSVSSQVSSATTIYLFDYLRDLSDPSHELEKILEQKGFVQTEKIDGRALGFVRVFVRKI